jgi:phosphoglycolate phosphatase
MISAIIFDLDGTLIDSKVDIIGSANFALKSVDKSPVTVSEGIQHVGKGAHYLLEKLLPGESTELISQCHSIFVDYYARNPVVHTKVYEGVIETLRFYENFPMFVVTNKSEKVAQLILQKLSLSKYFKQIIGGDTYPQLKPNPYAIEKIIEDHTINRQHILMVGDTDIDIQFGINAKIKTCRFENDFGAMGNSRSAKEDFTIKNFSELKNIIV